MQLDTNRINSLMYNFLGAPELNSSIHFQALCHSIRNQNFFFVLTHTTSHGHNHSLHRMLCVTDCTYKYFTLLIFLFYAYFTYYVIFIVIFY